MKSFLYAIRTPLLLTILFCVALFAYWGIWNGYFQQDEWLGFGNYLILKGENPARILSEMYLPMFSQQNVGHYLLLVLPLVNYLRSAVFGFNFHFYSFLSLFLHFIAVLCVYEFSLKISKDKLTAVLSSIFFTVASSASQAITWVGTSLPTQLAMIFSVLSIYYWLSWFDGKSKKTLVLSLTFLLLAVFSKETSLFLLIYLPLIGIIQKKRFGMKIAFLFAVLAIPYVVLRSNLLSLVISRISVLLKVVLVGTVQMLFPQALLLDGVNRFLDLGLIKSIPQKGNTIYEIFLQQNIIAPIIIALGILVLIILLLTLIRNRGKALLFSVLLTIISLVPLAFIPGDEIKSVFLSPRGLYIPLVGIAVIFGMTGSYFIKRKSVLIILCFVFLVMNIYYLRLQISDDVIKGRERKGILKEIKSSYPLLPSRVIFYTESDSSFYGLPPTERIFPFQSGFGQVLLVWYGENDNNLSKDFYRGRFLWNITDQGYQEFQGRGFGYFRSFEEMVAVIQERNLPVESVIAFSYDSESSSVKDMGIEVRGRIRGYLERKREVLINNSWITASVRSPDARFVVDGSRETAWNSMLPYARYQYFDIKLDRERTISRIQIDSFTNKDQNQVGYRVLLSKNANDWKEVFFAKRYPPDDDGYVNLYFNPETIKYIRIEQIGYHQFAPWVIHELKIYETVN